MISYALSSLTVVAATGLALCVSIVFPVATFLVAFSFFMVTLIRVVRFLLFERRQ